mmetsp:Transcript_36988/g.59877  ORF Transcript_36988/g.59877 Transcript_36988/m.59877 type:complete len:297 (+) Transcript_36988:178-1068(+)
MKRDYATANDLSNENSSPPVHHGSDDIKIQLNVGGRVFETWKSTLCKHSDTHLHSIFSDPNNTQNNEQIFFDRSPKVFEVILNFLRTSKTIMPPTMNRLAVEEEAKFYGLYKQMFGHNKDEVVCATEWTLDLSIDKPLNVSIAKNEKLRIKSIEGSGLVLLSSFSAEDKAEMKDSVIFDGNAVQKKKKRLPPVGCGPSCFLFEYSGPMKFVFSVKSIDSSPKSVNSTTAISIHSKLMAAAFTVATTFALCVDAVLMKRTLTLMVCVPLAQASLLKRQVQLQHMLLYRKLPAFRWAR